MIAAKMHQKLMMKMISQAWAKQNLVARAYYVNWMKKEWLNDWNKKEKEEEKRTSVK